MSTNYNKKMAQYNKPNTIKQDDTKNVEENNNENELEVTGSEKNFDESYSVTNDVNDKHNHVLIGKGNCAMLRVRNTPVVENDNTKTILKVGSKVEIDSNYSDDEFYSITTEDGIDGYCMKKFITV